MINSEVVALLLGLGLEPEDAAAVCRTASPAHHISPGEQLLGEGEPSSGVSLVLSGILRAYRTLADGALQTVALYGEGDVPDCTGYVLGASSSTIEALTACRVVQIPRGRLEALMIERPRIARMLWALAGRETAILQEWMIGMGRRTAYSQIAHLICEIATRMRLTPDPNDGRIRFPLTQIEISNMVGLSAVHVNRVVQALRADGLIEFGRGWLRIGDWSRLVRAGDFNPAYLRRAPIMAPLSV
jgi:CRP-like cAMP-binding protein